MTAKISRNPRRSFDTRSRLMLLALPAVLFILLGAVPVYAEETISPATTAAPTSPDQKKDDTQAPSPIEAAIAKLTVHGYLTQAYATADQHQIYGIPTDGTFDYRTAALQFRYDISPNDRVLFQLAHERIGKTSDVLHQNTIELDWLFYEHRFSPTLKVKVGRIQIPYGIFNETRDVGTLLPFYRLPLDFYGENSYASETVDGLVLSQRFFPEADWSLDVDAYVGGWDVALAGQTTKADIELAGGVHAWLSTPVKGLRVGAGFRRMRVTGLIAGGKPLPGAYWQDYSTSAEWDLGRFVARAEYRNTDIGDGSFFADYYGQVGYNVVGNLTVNAQYERSTNKFSLAMGPGTPKSVKTTLLEDKVLGLVYAFRPDLKVKAEYHRNKGFYVEDIPFSIVIQRMIMNHPFDSNYAIVSMAVSF